MAYAALDPMPRNVEDGSPDLMEDTAAFATFFAALWTEEFCDVIPVATPLEAFWPMGLVFVEEEPLVPKALFMDRTASFAIFCAAVLTVVTWEVIPVAMLFPAFSPIGLVLVDVPPLVPMAVLIAFMTSSARRFADWTTWAFPESIPLFRPSSTYFPLCLVSLEGELTPRDPFTESMVSSPSCSAAAVAAAWLLSIPSASPSGTCSPVSDIPPKRNSERSSIPPPMYSMPHSSNSWPASFAKD